MWKRIGSTALAVVALACGKTEPKEVPVTGDLTPRVETVGGDVVTPESAPVQVVPVPFAVAESVYQAKRYDEAAVMFRGYTEGKPENPWGQYMLGLSLWKSGDRDGAEAAFRKVIELDPTHSKSRLNLARVYLETGKPEQALEQIDSALTTDSGTAESFRILGRIRDVTGDLEGAVAAYRQALTLDSKDAWSMNNLGLALIKLEKPGDAIPVFALATQLKPENAVFQNNFGMALELAGYFTEAGKAYESAIQVDNGHQKAISNLARIAAIPSQADLPVLDLVAMAETFAKEIESWKTVALQ